MELVQPQHIHVNRIALLPDAWWMPAIRIPDEEIGGAPFFRPLHHERAQPGSIMVDRTGRRFVDEAQNYTDAGRAMLRFDAGAYASSTRIRKTWPEADALASAFPSWFIAIHALNSVSRIRNTSV